MHFAINFNSLKNFTKISSAALISINSRKEIVQDYRKKCVYVFIVVVDVENCFAVKNLLLLTVSITTRSNWWIMSKSNFNSVAVVEDGKFATIELLLLRHVKYVVLVVFVVFTWKLYKLHLVCIRAHKKSFKLYIYLSCS